MSSSESVLEGKKNLFQLGCVVDSAEMLGKAGSQMSMSMSSMDVEGSLGSDLAGRLGSVKPGQVDPKDVAPAVSRPFIVGIALSRRALTLRPTHPPLTLSATRFRSFARWRRAG